MGKNLELSAHLPYSLWIKSPQSWQTRLQFIQPKVGHGSREYWVGRLVIISKRLITDKTQQIDACVLTNWFS